MSTAPLRHEYVEASGLQHHLAVWDGGGDTTVLLLHGYLDTAFNWSFMVESFEPNDLHFVALDWRGHGDSDWLPPGGYYHFPDYVRDLEQIAAKVRRRRLIVVAHSMGAMVATLWLGARPDAADGLVLLEGLGPPQIPIDKYPDRFARWLDQTAPFDAVRFQRPMNDIEHVIRRLRRANPRLGQAMAERLAREVSKQDEAGRYHWKYDPLHRTRSPHPLLRDVARSFLDRIVAPTIWIGGSESPWLGPVVDDWLSSRPKIPRIVLPDAGHMVQNDVPKALSDELSEFIKRLHE